MVISYLQMLSHALPLVDSERVNFGTTTLVAFAVFHISVVEQVPKSSESIPLLAIYVDALMILISLSLLESFLMINWLSFVGYNVPAPVLWFYVVECCGPFLCLGQQGRHWRQNYLRVLAKLRQYHSELEQRQSLMKEKFENATKSRQFENIRQMAFTNFAYKGFDRYNIDVIAKLMLTYGDHLADLAKCVTSMASSKRKKSNKKRSNTMKTFRRVNKWRAYNANFTKVVIEEEDEEKEKKRRIPKLPNHYDKGENQSEGENNADWWPPAPVDISFTNTNHQSSNQLFTFNNSSNNISSLQNNEPVKYLDHISVMLGNCFSTLYIPYYNSYTY